MRHGEISILNSIKKPPAGGFSVWSLGLAYNAQPGYQRQLAQQQHKHSDKA
jgi:hypothetical protein